MTLQPREIAELRAALAEARSRGQKVERVDIGAFRRLVEHTPEDMTATAEAGMRLSEFQGALGRRGQWLPVDPAEGEHLTLGEVVNENLSGPRRFGYGTIRDYMLGMRVMLADGRVIRVGGKVVKNVAGYDLCKLFIGGRGTLGIVLEVTFKLRPLPEAEGFIEVDLGSLDELERVMDRVWCLGVSPIVFDAHRISGLGTGKGELGSLKLVLGFAGVREEVEVQLDRVRSFGEWLPSNLGYETRFWHGRALRETAVWSVLASEVPKELRKVGSADFVARVGNGLIYHAGERPRVEKVEGGELQQRVKDVFDPGHLFMELSV